ncbi:Hypothetical predicted protein [Mytilus galloprovincialis]|uniref:Endonuclease/exonuclease/phosphatase domain-containing protein n=1 Tax=Mytilus galloprovincialis TaxID=29158 RepID=A0A8B6GCA2_MYTGA|nr:Hypothetical predicted protein [Mytilus galloprovincialis]
MFPDNFSSKSGRGILIYVKRELKAVEVNIESEFKEHVWVKINLKDNDKLLTGCIYKIPSSDKTNHENLDELLMKVSRLEEIFGRLLVAGDVNFPKINWAQWEAGDETDLKFIECIRDCYFDQLVDKPT